MKRAFLLVLSFLLILSLSTGIASAKSVVVPTGEKVVYTDENWAYEKNNDYGYELDEYIGTSAVVELPWSFAKEYVTVVGDYAFNNNSTVTTVITTSKIEKIGDFAFNFCSSLEKIELQKSLTLLGDSCFYGNTSLTDINLEDTAVTAVPEYCFAECGFSEIILPLTCTSIGKMAFYNCTGLTKITIPESVTEIAENAFEGCSNLIIYGKRGSYAIEFAIANDIPYVETDYKTVTYVIGDADGDGTVTIIDATKIQRVLVDLDEDTEGMVTLRGHTYPEDDTLSIIDATRIQRYLVDFEVDAEFGKEVTTEIHIG